MEYATAPSHANGVEILLNPMVCTLFPQHSHPVSDNDFGSESDHKDTDATLKIPCCHRPSFRQLLTSV